MSCVADCSELTCAVVTALLVYCITVTLLLQRFTSSFGTYLAKAIGSKIHGVLMNSIKTCNCPRVKF